MAGTMFYRKNFTTKKNYLVTTLQYTSFLQNTYTAATTSYP